MTLTRRPARLSRPAASAQASPCARIPLEGLLPLAAFAARIADALPQVGVDAGGSAELSLLRRGQLIRQQDLTLRTRFLQYQDVAALHALIRPGDVLLCVQIQCPPAPPAPAPRPALRA